MEQNDTRAFELEAELLQVQQRVGLIADTVQSALNGHGTDTEALLRRVLGALREIEAGTETN
jgi:hypothetical protein